VVRAVIAPRLIGSLAGTGSLKEPCPLPSRHAGADDDGANDVHDRPVLLYGNDPLCGWCFAIGPALLEARRRLGDLVRWRLETGLLVTGGRVRPIAHDRDYLRQGLAQVAAIAGRRVGDAYWRDIVEDGTWVSDSEPAVRAVVVARELAPGSELAFSHALTDALYLDGRRPDDPATLRTIAEELGLDGDEVVATWGTDAARRSTAEAATQARALGVETYPSLFLLEPDGTPRPLLAGYADADTIEATVRAAVRTPVPPT
jgi:putative protein-disulfide isomerase